MISTLALLAKKTIEAAWLNGPAYDLATLAAEALEAEGLLQAPGAGEALARADAEYERLRVALESAKRGRRESRARVAELERLRSERDRYRTAWGMARTRAISVGGAADRYAARAREGQEALQHMLFTVIVAQLATSVARREAEDLRARVAELEATAEAALAGPRVSADGITRRIAPTQALRDDEEWVRCSHRRCPNSERRARAAERGWSSGDEGAWKCPEHDVAAAYDPEADG
ncbi:hypothetical protein ACFW2X_06535 [Streptomyces antibioticus]|uniref:hypothetical protein n=1 Tax=Streptomyces antibioticus TaxID=1890 RepID=UPI0036C91EC7